MILMRNKKCTRSTKCEANASSSVASIVEMCGLSITVEYKYRRLSLYSTWNEPTQTSIFSLLGILKWDWTVLESRTSHICRILFKRYSVISVLTPTSTQPSLIR
jgi:hypothetical protein